MKWGRASLERTLREAGRLRRGLTFVCASAQDAQSFRQALYNRNRKLTPPAEVTIQVVGRLVLIRKKASFEDQIKQLERAS